MERTPRASTFLAAMMVLGLLQTTAFAQSTNTAEEPGVAPVDDFEWTELDFASPAPTQRRMFPDAPASKEPDLLLRAAFGAEPLQSVESDESVSFEFHLADMPRINLGMFQSEDASQDETPTASTDSAAEMARKLQDPLANIKAIITDNDILFKTGNDEVSYSFQMQPVYAIDFPDADFSLVLRGVIPFMGIAPEAQRPMIGEPLAPGGSRVWGVGDIVTQFLFAPKTDKAWKFGFGPQLSWRTRTDNRLGGPGWGAGPAGVVVGNITDDLSAAVIVGQLWSYDGDFSTTLVQPNLYYNFPDIPGAYVAYNAPITYDWNADSSNALTLPLGAVVGRAFDIGGGHGLDLSIGPYWNAVKPDGSNEWQIKFGVTIVFP